MKSLTSNKVVMVEWVDSRCCIAGWYLIDDYENTAPKVISIGYLVEKNKSFLHIVPHVGSVGEDDEQIQGAMIISMAQVIKITALKAKK